MYSTTFLALAASLTSVTAHVALWDKGMFGLNFPDQVGAAKTNWNNNEPVNPLRELDGFTTDQWFGHGLKGFPPAAGDFMVLPSGGRYNGDVQCNRAGTRLRDPAIQWALPKYACDTEGPLHVMNKFNSSTIDYSKFGGTALAIAYTSDVASLQPNDMTVISVNHNSVWEREISYDIPAGLPPCPEGGCLCTWNWIHQSGGTEGYGNEMYNVLYRCQVTGSTNAANVVQRGQVPRKCESDPSTCVKGPKTPMAEGNNIPRQSPPPIYRSNWGFEDGAQNDIFTAGSTPAATTYIDNAYATGTATATRTTPVASATAIPSGWTALGCMVDDSNTRALDGGSTQMSNMTIEGCVSSCANKGFNFAGLEYGQECWCGNKAIMNTAPASECNVRCGGDQWSFCGGGYRMNMYRSPSAPTTTSATPTGTPTPIAASALPTGWSALGCHVDDGSNRALNAGSTTSNNLTIAGCISTCNAKGLPYAGVEYGQECWCGSQANLIPASDGCTSRCGGDPGTVCGGGYRINIFRNDALVTTTLTSASSTSSTSSSSSVPTTTSSSTTSIKPSTTSSSSSSSAAPSPSVSLPAGWQALGCSVDSASLRVLNGSYWDTSTLTPSICAARCKTNGFAYAGLQYGRQCYCGSSIGNANMVSSGCSMACAGDKSLTCGGNYRMNLMAFTASTSSFSSSSSAQPTTTTPPATGGGQIEYRTVTVTATVTTTVNTCASPTATLAKRHTRFEGRRYLTRIGGRD